MFLGGWSIGRKKKCSWGGRWKKRENLLGVVTIEKEMCVLLVLTYSFLSFIPFLLLLLTLLSGSTSVCCTATAIGWQHSVCCPVISPPNCNCCYKVGQVSLSLQ